ncbi:hypothetical protein COF65_33010 [Bacillus toyonensis]|uniref:hypothetical protein n=1 Tax=Bacillus cereus group TaxID=86661 RepID=UPI000BF319EA|nr:MULTISPECIES: hypothetical protein [Bacillus cereus group]PEQ70136.1 hypothetical protein CN474_18395 [Bacillus thuringiensis]PHD30221.1 hypothetical protein COF65_33010 [Bacillus toyonensis]
MNKNETNIKPAMKAHEVIGIRSIQVVIIILLISFLYIGFNYQCVNTVEGLVIDKLQQGLDGEVGYGIVIREEDGSEQLIKNSEYVNIVKVKNKSESKFLQDGIEKGKKYKFKVRGLRITDFKQYPNLISYTLTNDEIREQMKVQNEQSMKNKKIAEELVAQELNIDKKYIQFVNTFNDEKWIHKNLSCTIKTNNKEYHVEFNTDKIENSINQEMYQPTTINKFIVK